MGIEERLGEENKEMQIKVQEMGKDIEMKIKSISELENGIMLANEEKESIYGNLCKAEEYISTLQD